MYLIKKIVPLLLILFSSIYSQLELRITSDKEEYKYGEKIIITASVTNISDSSVTIRSGCYNSWQAEFEFNDYYSAKWSICLATVQYLDFDPNMTRNYSWNIDPEQLGLPNKEGLQCIIGHYFYNNLTDTIYINAPLYRGGQLSVGFQTSNGSSLSMLKDSLKIKVLEHYENPFSNNISETWQINGYPLDSLQQILSLDKRFEWVEFNRHIMYDKINVTSVRTFENILDDYIISDAYPNPFNSMSNFYVELPKTKNARIELFNVLGEQINTIYKGLLEKNRRYNFQINSNGLASGVYYYVLFTSEIYKSKKIVFLK